MDLNNLRPQVTEMEIQDPAGNPTGVVFSLIGKDTKQFRDKFKSIVKTNTAKKTKEVDLDSLEEQNAELLATSIVGWKGLTEGGVEVPYSPDKALSIIKDPELAFIKEQVEEFIQDRKNFFR